MRHSFAVKLVLPLCCATLFALCAGAQTQGSKQGATQPQQQEQKDNQDVSPEVEGIFDCSGLHTGSSNEYPIDKPDCGTAGGSDDRMVFAGIGDTIAIQVKDLKKWVEKEKSKSDVRKLVPYLDDRPLLHLYPASVSLDEDKLVFTLTFSPESKNAWMSLLGPHQERKLKLSVGFEDKPPFATHAAFKLRIFQKLWVGCFALVFLVALVAFFYLAKKSGILREQGPSPASGKPKPFSLARSQMAVWFIVVLACYLFILVITWDKNILPDSVLTLIGISAGTYLGAVLVDSGKQSDAQAQLPALQAEFDTLKAVGAPNAQQTARLNELTAKIAQHSAAMYPDESHGFWTDILSDVNGVSLHRFQMVVWTGVVVVLFVKSVWSSLVIPELSGTLLGLMGISSGTYLGSKFPEQKK